MERKVKKEVKKEEKEEKVIVMRDNTARDRLKKLGIRNKIYIGEEP